jgi:hypothetical protein
LRPARAAPAWIEANQQSLTAEIATVRALLSRRAGQPIEAQPNASSDIASALDLACERLELSSFERKIVVMCAAVELDASFASLCAQAQGDPARAYPSFGLALSAFDDAHWSALAPAGSLRRWGLIEVQRGVSITLAALRIDEALLHELTGVSELDTRLAAFVLPIDVSESLIPTHDRIAEEIAGVFNLVIPGRPAPCILLVGNDDQGKQQVAAHAFARLGMGTYAMDASSLQGPADDIETRARAWEREARLRLAGLFIDAYEVPEPLERDGLGRFLDRFATPVVIGTRHPLKCGRRLIHILEVTKPTRFEQRELWWYALSVIRGEPVAAETSVLHAAIKRMTTHFDLDAAAIEAIVQRAAAQPDGPIGQRIWNAARGASRNELSEIAQRLDGQPDWADLILPEDQLETLRDIIAHARNRTVVHDDWGMGERHERGLGLGALFHGPSGTGKTMAAEVLGTEMDLDVYRVDLSQLVSKYIGETEKNLRRVFDAAEDGGAILLFDECDAIFGKRGEIEHGQDRYANLEVSYLLQRMESYRGIAILTTNMRSAIDPAFMRRLRFVVAFPFPDYEQRIAIWKRSLAPGVPVEGLDFARLARLNVAGGNIRNIALHAAFLAADALRPVTMAHLRRAALAECGKLERAPSDVEIGGWA